MGRPNRSEVFCASEVGIVHTVQRCVRRAWLAGVDQVTGKDYSFRREWSSYQKVPPTYLLHSVQILVDSGQSKESKHG